MRICLLRRAACLAALSLLGAPPPAAGEQPTLTVVNWSWYVETDEEADESLPVAERSPVLRQFAAETGCRLVYIELDDEYSIRDLLTGDPAGIDVVNLSTGFIQALSRQGALARLDPGLLPHLPDIRPNIRRLIPDEVWPYQAPYFAGQTGILYNAAAVGGHLDTWSGFWSADAAFQVAVLGGPETVLGTFLMLAGEPISTDDSAVLRGAARAFQRQLQAGRVGYLGDDLESMAALVAAGELGASFMYTGDALGFIDDDETGQLRYALPRDGVEFFVDSWAVSASSSQPELAHRFIDFMLRPGIQVRQSLALYTQVVTMAARDGLAASEPEHPHLELLRGGEDLDDREQLIHRGDTREIDALWSRVMESTMP